MEKKLEKKKFKMIGQIQAYFHNWLNIPIILSLVNFGQILSVFWRKPIIFSSIEVISISFILLIFISTIIQTHWRIVKTIMYTLPRLHTLLLLLWLLFLKIWGLKTSWHLPEFSKNKEISYNHRTLVKYRKLNIDIILLSNV